MEDEAIYMLNALWFKKDGGAEKYQEYVAAVEPLIADLGASFEDGYSPQKAILGEWNPDIFFVVRYPNKAAFDALINSPEHHKIMHLREEAIEDSLLIRCSKMAFE